MNKNEIWATALVICVFLLIVGVIVSQNLEVEYLTEKTQEQFWEIKGLEQKYNTCQWELDNEREVLLKIKSPSVSGRDSIQLD